MSDRVGDSLLAKCYCEWWVWEAGECRRGGHLGECVPGWGWLLIAPARDAVAEAGRRVLQPPFAEGPDSQPCFPCRTPPAADLHCGPFSWTLVVTNGSHIAKLFIVRTLGLRRA